MKMHFTCLCNVKRESVKSHVAHTTLPPAPPRNRASRHCTDWDRNRTHSPPCSLGESLEIRIRNWALGSLHAHSRAHPGRATCERAERRRLMRGLRSSGTEACTQPHMEQCWFLGLRLCSLHLLLQAAPPCGRWRRTVCGGNGTGSQGHQKETFCTDAQITTFYNKLNR